MTQNFNPFCELWNGTFTGLFHGSAFVFTAAFAVPQNFKLGFLTMRTLILVALILTTVWSLETVCMGPDLFLWNSAFIVINIVYVLALIKKHFPVLIPKEMMNFYNNILKPLFVTKKVSLLRFILIFY